MHGCAQHLVCEKGFCSLVSLFAHPGTSPEGQPSSGPACGVGGEGRTWQTQWDGKGRYPRGPELRTEGKGLEVGRAQEGKTCG